MTATANYTARKMVVDGFDVLRLADAACRTEVSIVPALGNNVYEMKVAGANILWAPFSLKQLSEQPSLAGNPFMAPWANRLDRDAFYANGKRYQLNPSLGNFLRDSNGLPIHGLLTRWPEWKLIALEADESSSRATHRLEFWKYPDLMAQFPFAHTIEISHHLRNGVLEVATRLENHSTEAMPVSLGYHPFFQIRDAHRDSWKVHLAARTHMPLTDALIPTGRKATLKVANRSALASLQSTYVLSDLVRGEDGCAEFWVEGVAERITLIQGPKYGICVFYAPPGEDYLCFEPMTATINALNPRPDGGWHELPRIRPGGAWRESFWIRVSPRRRNPKDRS